MHGYKEEGTVTTPFDMTVLNELDRYHLVLAVIQRVPGLAARTANLERQLLDKLAQHRQYINEHGVDLPEVREWAWSSPEAGRLR